MAVLDAPRKLNFSTAPLWVSLTSPPRHGPASISCRGTSTGPDTDRSFSVPEQVNDEPE